MSAGTRPHKDGPSPGLPDVRSLGARWCWAAIAVFAFAVRAAYLLESSANPFRHHLNLDPEFYHDWARRILSGQLFGPDVFPQAPLYPYLLASVYAITGPNVLAPLWLQAAMGAATVAIGAGLAGRWFGRPAMIATALLLAFYKPAIFYTGVLLVPVLAGLLVALALWFADRRPWLAGIFTGLTALAHPVLLPGTLIAAVTAQRLSHDRALNAGRKDAGGSNGSGPPRADAATRSPVARTLASTLARTLARALRPSLPIFAGCVIAIAPATLHNLIESGRFVPISANSGINFYIGNGPEANGFYGSPFGLRAERDLLGVNEASYRAGRKLTTVESSGYWNARAWDAVRARPLHALGLYLRKVYFTLFAWETPQVESLDFEKRYSTLLRIPLLPNWILLLVLSASALVLLPRGRILRGWGAAVLTTALAIAVYFATARFRFPMHVPLALMAGAALGAMYEAWHARDRHAPGARLPVIARLPAAAAVAVLIVVAFVPNWLRVQKNLTHGQYYFRLGLIAEEEQRSADAMKAYEDALAIDPTVARAAVNLGILQARNGNLAAAEPLLERGVRLDPRSARGLLSLGQIHQLRGDLAAACSLYAASFQADTSYVRALESLAAARYANGEPAEAESDCRGVIRRAGNDPLTARCRFLLDRWSERRRFGWPAWVSREASEGDLAFAVNDLATAEARYQASLARDPRDPSTILALIRIASVRGDRAAAERLAASYRQTGAPAAALAGTGL